MEWKTLVTIYLSSVITLAWGQNTDQCTQVVFVESPTQDTYISAAQDTGHYGHELVLRLKGTPEKKKMSAVMSYQVHHIDAHYVTNATLKIYTVSKKNESNLTIYGVSDSIDETHTNWRNLPQQELQALSTHTISGDPFVEFDVTGYVKNSLQDGRIQFLIESDGKKIIDISARESGLNSELAISLCTPIDRSILIEHNKAAESQYNMEILPSNIPGKMTIQLIGVPAGGFGTLMIMDEAGDVLRQLPMSIRKGDALYHTVDFGKLLPGNYWAMFRKGRILIKDEFRMRPSKAPDRLVEVELLTAEASIDEKH